MYYTIYKITNQINGKIYIGSHKTKNLNDNYMGSGKYLKRAIEKHGVENFTKEILFVFDNPDEMYAKEAELVNEEFLAEENTYNLKVGGFGGFDYINTQGSNQYPGYKENAAQNLIKARSVVRELHLDEKWNKDFRSKVSAGLYERINERGAFFTGKKHKESSKRLIGEKNSELQKGERNSQHGTMWIFNEELKQSKKIKKTDAIPDGWCKGRKMF